MSGSYAAVDHLVRDRLREIIVDCSALEDCVVEIQSIVLLSWWEDVHHHGALCRASQVIWLAKEYALSGYRFGRKTLMMTVIIVMS